MGGAVLSAAMIAWAQSQIEGIPADKYKKVAEGLTWRWSGEPLSLAGRPGALLLTEEMANSTPSISSAPVPPQANHVPPQANHVPPQAEHVLPQANLTAKPAGSQIIAASPEFGSSFVVTDGARVFSGLPVTPGGIDAPLLVFHDGVPPVATDLTIVQAEPSLLRLPHKPDPTALLCFTPGTEINTAEGPVKIEDLGPGDRVLTRDNGAQEVVWVGHRRLSGARLFALPGERPIRIRQGAMHGAGPYLDLLVSPGQRILRRDRQARALWGQEEVLVRAADLLGQPGVSVDHCLTETYYINLMLENHEVIWANGMEVESFHPGSAGLEGLSEEAKSSLLDLRPDLVSDPHRYGPTVRRALSPAEAEILRYAAR